MLRTRVIGKVRGCLSEVEKKLLARHYYGQSQPPGRGSELYGVISYMPSSNEARYCNLGDEFQSIAATKFLPRVDAFVPRDDLRQIYPRELTGRVRRLTVILAARFYGPPTHWPPPPHLTPIFAGFRMEPGREAHRAGFSRPEVVEYLKAHEPIGCRDAETSEFLDSLGLKTVLTGCMTLTLQRKDFADGECRGNGDVLLVDVPEQLLKVIPPRVRRDARCLSQILARGAPQTQAYRTEMACNRLQTLASARLVVTTMVHAALASRALGTPVILLDISDDIARRVGGMQAVLHTFKIRDGELPSDFQDFDWMNIPPNPGSEELSTLTDRTIGILSARGLERTRS
jgi:hypothetical protein